MDPVELSLCTYFTEVFVSRIKPIYRPLINNLNADLRFKLFREVGVGDGPPFINRHPTKLWDTGR